MNSTFYSAFHQRTHHNALRNGPCFMGSHTVTCHPRVLEPHLVIYIRNLQQQSPTVYLLLQISSTHERMIAWFKLESATGSWTRAIGVRGECVTTQPRRPTCVVPLFVLFLLNVLSSLSCTFMQSINVSINYIQFWRKNSIRYLYLWWYVWLMGDFCVKLL